VGGTPEDPLPSDRLGKAVVWSPLSGWAREHEADFHGATVGLYPGTIDRLW
jgi:aminoglycoside 2'-N-acetyltransferase I